MQIAPDDWFYHVWHLADGDPDRRDCRVCHWYRNLKPSTIRRNLRGTRRRDDDE